MYAHTAEKLPQNSRTQRNVIRSNRHKLFLGHLTMILDQVNRWKLYEDNPLQWLLEFREHKLFNQAISALTESHYSEDMTEDKMKSILLSINMSKFLSYIGINADDPPEKIEPTVSVVDGDAASTPSSSTSVQSSTITSPEQSVDEELMDADVVKNIEEQFEITVDHVDSDDWCDDNDLEHDMLISSILWDDSGNSGTSQQGPGTKQHVSISAYRKKLKDNNVYWLSNRLYFGRVRFPILIYAPPHSGKSTANSKLFGGKARDTDKMFYWGLTNYHPVVFTNMPHLINRADFSIAVVPSRSTFRSRLKRRRIKIGPGWYAGLIRDSNNATVTIRSDLWLTDVITRNLQDFHWLSSYVDENLNKNTQHVKLANTLRNVGLRIVATKF